MAAHLFFGLSPLLQKFLSVITFTTTESCDNNNNYCARKISLNYLCTTVSTWNALVWPMAQWHVQDHLRKYLRVATQINRLNAFHFAATDSLFTARSHLLRAPLSPVRSVLHRWPSCHLVSCRHCRA